MKLVFQILRNLTPKNITRLWDRIKKQQQKPTKIEHKLQTLLF